MHELVCCAYQARVQTGRYGLCSDLTLAQGHSPQAERAERSRLGPGPLIPYPFSPRLARERRGISTGFCGRRRRPQNPPEGIPCAWDEVRRVRRWVAATLMPDLPKRRTHPARTRSFAAGWVFCYTEMGLCSPGQALVDAERCREALAASGLALPINPEGKWVRTCGNRHWTL